MKPIFLLASLIFLSGCCANQYSKNGFDFGVSCVSPHKSTKEKTCLPETGEANCKQQVETVKKSIENQRKQ